MADSLLNFDYNTIIDKALGTTNQPFKGLINDPNYQSSLNVNTLLGLGTGYVNSLYKDKTSGEKLLSTLTGGKAGRQKGINDYVQNILTQQQYSKNVLDMALNKGKLNKQPLELLELQGKLENQPYELEKLQYDTAISGQKYRAGSIAEKAIMEKMRKLQESGEEDLLIQFMQNPDEYFNAARKSDSRFREISKLSVAEENIAKSLGMDIKDPSKNTQFQHDAFLDIITTPSDDVVKSHNASERKQKLNNANYQINEMKTATQKLNEYRKQNQDGSIKPQSVISEQTGLNNSVYRSPTFPPEENYPAVKVNGKEIGGYIDYYGEKYTPEQWNSLGIQQQKALNPRLSQDQVEKKLVSFETNGMDSGKAASYIMDTISRSNKVIRQLMADPEAIKDMQSGFGKLLINLKAGKYGFQSRGQDAANLLKLIQNKQFINQIQEMRNNNATGGAVGNVSDREVAMFISAAAALQDTSSPEALYSQMLDLHRTGEGMVQKQAEKYKKAFGDEYYSIWGLEESLNDVNVGFVFPTTFKEALQKQRIEKMNMDMGLGNNLPVKNQYTVKEIF